MSRSRVGPTVGPDDLANGLVMASNNPDKAREIEAILAGVPIHPRPTDLEEIEETGSSLVENARLKAHAVAVAVQMPAIADDTGLEVAALGGAPGIYAARYAGEHATYLDNVAKLLEQLGDQPNRSATFLTVAMIALPDGREIYAEGRVEGTISTEARGSGGFGYDPVFQPDEGGGLTYAEMDPVRKNAISHRGRALRALAEKLGL
jgi:XTP/dITP diphosphohydrolase